MYKGGPNYTPQSAKIISYTGLLLPVILVIYGLSIQAGYVISAQYLGDASFFSLSACWVALGVVQFLAPIRTKLDAVVRLSVYHLLAAAYLLFVSGVATPLVAAWILLLFLSRLYFKKSGLALSILWFVVVVIVDVIFWLGISAAIISYDLVTLAAILLSGIVIQSVALSRKVDQTELQQSKRQESLQRDRVLTIVNNLADAVLSTDMDGIIRVYNAASLNLLDTNDSLNGKHIDDVLKLVDQSRGPVKLSQQFKTAKGALTRDDLNYVYDDEEEIRLEITYSPIRSSYSRSKKSQTHDGYIVIMRDITKAKSLEEERDEFISVVSHELRTPITIVEGTISNVQLMMKHPDATQLMLTDAITMAHDQIVYLAHMVNDLSTLSRAERGVANSPEDIDVLELVHKLHDEYDKEATDKGLHLNLD
ncbi:MAG: histidine kinase dimerization/phospho-acceptor domain-containing protein, partial [Candidatus Saccharibacteria bacterium]